MKYDIFTFFNELDLLEIRLNILYDHVDYFVIIECTETFSGLPKPLYFQDNQDRFKKFQDKIIHYVVQNVPANEAELRLRLQDTSLSELERDIITQTLTSDNIVPGVTHWLKEFYQKECIRKALVHLNDDDICFISDVDEIWNPTVEIDYSQPAIYKLKQNMYAYYLNNRSDEAWAGTLVTQYRNIRNSCLNHLRTASKTSYTYIANGGWHFTNQGGIEKIIAKLEAEYSADDFNTSAIKSRVQKRMLKNQDYIGRSFHFKVEDTYLPDYILEHRSQYANLFKPTSAPIIVKLSGGLGNQLFQYAIGKTLATLNNTSLLLDLNGFDQQPTTNTPRQYALKPFRISEPAATSDDLRRFVPSKFKWLNRIKKYKYVVETNYEFDPGVLRLRGQMYLMGYWQSPKYFTTIIDDLRHNLTLRSGLSPSAKVIAEKMTTTQAVSLHVRRGDYVSNPTTNQYHGLCNLEYYQAAIHYICQLVDSPTFFIFSDDIHWAKEHLPLSQDQACYVSAEQLPDYEELMLMKACQHNIIANSSFSWWGAWLNPNPNKVVIAPKKWFNNETINTTDLLPVEWLKL